MNKIFQSHTYYSASKAACGFDYKLISFESLSKLKCIEELMKSLKTDYLAKPFFYFHNIFQPASNLPTASSGCLARRLAATGTTGGAIARTSQFLWTMSNSSGRWASPQMPPARSASPLNTLWTKRRIWLFLKRNVTLSLKLYWNQRRNSITRGWRTNFVLFPVKVFKFLFTNKY